MSLAETLFRPAGFKVSFWACVFFTSLATILLASGSWEGQPGAETDLLPQMEVAVPLTGLVAGPIAGSGCGDLVCERPETQVSCPSDCRTVAKVTPLVLGDGASVVVEFWDSRYEADGRVQIDLRVDPEGLRWAPGNGCPVGGVDMGTGDWPEGTVSEDGHFRMETACALPAEVGNGLHALVANTTITLPGSVRTETFRFG